MNDQQDYLCNLLYSLQLSPPTTARPEVTDSDVKDAEVDMGICTINHAQSHPEASSNDETHACAYLLTLQSQLANDSFSTTGNEYLEAIFTHREIFSAHPSAHRHCGRHFADIARMLERREWQPDRENDMEAAAAFRYEAWMIGTMLPA